MTDEIRPESESAPPLVVQARRMVDNPLIRHYFRLDRDKGLASAIIPPVFLALVISYLLIFVMDRVLPAFLYLDELAFWIGFPAFILTGLFMYFRYVTFFQNHISVELALSRTPASELSLALYITMVSKPLITGGLVALLVPAGAEKIASMTVTGGILFAFSFIWILEWVSRILFLLLYQVEGVMLFFVSLLAGFVGFSMMYGVAGFLRLVQDDWLVTPVATAIAIAFAALVSGGTFQFFGQLAGRCYRRKIQQVVEEDPWEWQKPERKVYTEN